MEPFQGFFQAKETETMKAIILAAGQGLRLRPLTETLPKCLAIVLGGRPLLEWQLQSLRAAGVEQITMVRGYQAEKLRYPGIRYVLNPQYDRTNILASLACAMDELVGDVIVTYADIWYDTAVVQSLLGATADVSIAVDPQGRIRYLGRDSRVVTEQERVVIGPSQQVVKIARMIPCEEPVDAEFIGMMKLTEQGCRIFRKHYAQFAARFCGKPFQRAVTFEQAYLSDFLQAMVEAGEAVQCRPIEGSWCEIDTLADLRNVEMEFVGRDG